jgi:hypothetical protein
MIAGLDLPATATRVEAHTNPEVNRSIEASTDARVAELERAGTGSIARRLDELEREWDIERVLQLNASLIAGTGLALGLAVHRRFLLLPIAVFTFFAQHAIQGWCPPIPLFRRLGVRTAREIARERYALKALRGDFDGLLARDNDDISARVDAALRAVDR